jgi:CHAT domain-containing protein
MSPALQSPRATSRVGAFFTPALLALAFVTGCNRSADPKVAFEAAQQTFIHGDLAGTQKQAERGFQQFRNSHPEWAWKFRLLEAESLLWSGMYERTLETLKSLPNPRPPDVDLAALPLEAAAHARLHQFEVAEHELNKADSLCRGSVDVRCGAVLRARGMMAAERGRLDDATHFYGQSLAFSRERGDRFSEATALLNLAATLVFEEHFGEAADASRTAYDAAESIGARDVSQTALGNLGFAYYRLGDSERALDLYLEAEKRAVELGDISNQVAWVTNIGYVQMDAGKFDLAEQSYKRALDLARGTKSQQEIFNGLRALAKVSVQAGKYDQATQCADEAIALAKNSGNRSGELYPMLVKGQVASRRGDAERAEQIFREVEADPKAPAALIWGARHALAQLHEQQGKKELAEREYRAALSTFEAARTALEREDAKLPFVTNASRVYGDYLNFLVAQGKTDQALEVADYSRAQTLAEGLGRLRKGTSFAPEPVNAPLLARKTGGTILFYWLGEKQSYLWTITPQKTSLARLAPASEINATAQRYKKALLGPLDVVDSNDDAGMALYQMLIAPAGIAFPKDSKVYVIPDGSLNSLNFETLLAPEPKVHYWIEDVTVVNASSLRLLAAAQSVKRRAGQKLLLLGDPAPADHAYPQLSNANAEIDGVRKYFPSSAQTVLAKELATPLAYLKSDPGQFGYIHFVAHGTASRLSPLDSAVVLSRGTSEADSFKLYARDIVKLPLRAELVTISTCYGSGSRAYTGEGLVGLSWAFLRAGAHNVIGALWEVSDVSTPGLMEQMYSELEKGGPPEKALRDAKLGLLHSGTVYRAPFYWAPFQLYTGS